MIKLLILCFLLSFFITLFLKSKNKKEDINKKEINKEEENTNIPKILKVKNSKIGSYRNYANQNSLKRINRKKPKYLNKYSFSKKSFDNEKLEVENSKYKLIEEREQIFFNKKELPSSYLVDEIVLMPKNTNTLFTYWEIKEDTYNNLKEKYILKNENPVIIIKDINNNEKLRIQTYLRNGSMYINNVDSNSEYIAFIGFIDLENKFIEVTHSNEALVPNPNKSDNFEVNWGVSEIEIRNNTQIINFKNLNKDNIEEYLGFKQEINDPELIYGEKELIYNKNIKIGASESINLIETKKIGSSDKNL